MIDLAMVADGLLRAVRQLGDFAFIRVLLLSVVLAMLVTGPFYLVFVFIAWLLEWILPASVSLPGVGEVGFLGIYTVGLVSKTTWVFWTYVMSPVAVAIIGVLLERIVDAVEARHYPHQPAVRHRSIARMIGYNARFLMLMLGVSLAALVVSFFSGVLAPLIFVAANGYLIGREYFEMVALRRLDDTAAAQMMRQNLPLIWLTGAAVALMLSVPFVNLVAPLVGVAALTHLYYRLVVSAQPVGG